MRGEHGDGVDAQTIKGECMRARQFLTLRPDGSSHSDVLYSLIVTVVTLLPVWVITSRTPEVCGNLSTSLPIEGCAASSLLRSAPATNQHGQLYVRSHCRYRRSPDARRVAPFTTDLSQIDPVGHRAYSISIRSELPPDNDNQIKHNPNQATAASTLSTCTVGSSDRRR
jgi:hypothetical protein